MSKYEDQSDYENAICPYCEATRFVETEEYDVDEREVKCRKCGKKYWISQEFTVSHEARPDCKLNGEECKYAMGTCTVCGGIKKRSEI